MPDSSEQSLREESTASLMERLVLQGLRRKLRRALTRWCIRTAIGALVFGWLAWRFPWGRWVLYSWLPLSLLSLGVIIYGFRVFARRVGTAAEMVESDGVQSN